jgi:hypothetical protein
MCGSPWREQLACEQEHSHSGIADVALAIVRGVDGHYQAAGSKSLIQGIRSARGGQARSWFDIDVNGRGQ